MQIIVARKWLTPNATVGRIILDGIDSFFSMERAATDPLRIPAGDYTVSLHVPNAPLLRATLASMQSKYDAMETVDTYPQLNSPLIAKRDPILFHPGNRPTDSDGCILVGMGIASDHSYIIEAQLACSQLIPMIVSAVKSNGGCSLTVTDPQIVTDIDLE